ncbi:PREDICTED: ephrin-B3 [Pseudopodoces humilis]|uniref:ephrin-B3 n=1 Tax=Pseudopodoces humilis TaxID=181119 RepID=UPI0006B72F81|nr:PREDICTED: ephrin-B3 [Pseudopodoces humilis]
MATATPPTKATPPVPGHAPPQAARSQPGRPRRDPGSSPGWGGGGLEPVVWHTGNRRFLAAGGYVLYPQIGDRLDLVCPGGGAYEYYKLYLVGVAQARLCQVPPAPTLLLTCDRPQRDVRFTIKFQEFSPNLWGHEFRRKHDYYIITTSDGTPEGLENREGGACLTRAMRVTLRVGQRPGAEPPPEEDWTGGGACSSRPPIGCEKPRPPKKGRGLSAHGFFHRCNMAAAEGMNRK